MDYKKPQSALVHGGAGIYPLTTADQVILSDGSRLEKDGKISADSAADSAKLGGKAPEYYIQPRNLLDNSDFTNPVNQRSISSVTTTGYTIDRWVLQDAGDGISLSDDGVTFNATNNLIVFTQKVNKEIRKNLIGKTVTLSAADTNGNVGIVTAVIPEFGKSIDSTQNSIGDTNIKVNIFATSDEDTLQIRILSDSILSSVTIVNIALYEGSYTADTLPPYVPKGYAAELAECRRYAKYITGALAGIAHGYESGKAYATIFTSGPKMRIAPSVADYSKIMIINGEYYSINFTPITGISTIAAREDSITFWIESSEISAGKDYYISCDNGVLFSSDL